MNNGTTMAQIQFRINSVNQGSATTLPGNSLTYTCPTTTPFNWQKIWVSWNSGSSTSAVIGIIDVNIDGGGNDFGLDDISFSTLSPVSMSSTASNNTPVCAGSTINLSSSAAGGSDPLTYSWTGPNSYSSAVQNPVIAYSTPAMAGTYTVTVTDINGCTTTASTSVTVTAPTFTTAVISNVSCFGGNDGSIKISITSSNNGPYTYSINNGTNYIGTLSGTFPNYIITGLTATTYKIKIKDVNGCESANCP
jgi:hypothetical protein